MYEIKSKSAKRGGKRSGAGRKSLYGAPTKAIRVPENMVAEIKDFIEYTEYSPNKTIVGERVKRSESLFFKICYNIHKILTFFYREIN